MQSRPDITALKAALEATTKGEWVWGEVLRTSRIVVFEDDNSLVLKDIVVSSVSDGHDATFIALAHNEMDDLLNYIESLENSLKDIRNGVEGNRGNCADCESVAIVAEAALSNGK